MTCPSWVPTAKMPQKSLAGSKVVASSIMEWLLPGLTTSMAVTLFSSWTARTTLEVRVSKTQTRPEARPTTIRDEEIVLECGANGAAQVISFCRPILRSGLLLDDAPAEADTVGLAVPNVHAEVRSFPSTTSSEGPR